MVRLNASLFFCVGLVLLLSSCAKEGPTGPTGPAGPSFTGSLTGHVKLYDKYGSPVLTNLNIVRLTLSGTAATLPAQTVMYTDYTGYYNYPAISTGNYTIAAQDTSTSLLYAPTQVSNIDFVSGTLVRDISLSAIPDSFLSAFASHQNAAATGDSLAIKVVVDNRQRNCIIFVNSSATATGYLLKYIVPIPANTAVVNLFIPTQDLLNAGFTDGKTVYYSAYSYVVNDVSVYENATGQWVYTAINATPLVDSALVP